MTRHRAGHASVDEVDGLLRAGCYRDYEANYHAAAKAWEPFRGLPATPENIAAALSAIELAAQTPRVWDARWPTDRIETVRHRSGAAVVFAQKIRNR